MGNQRKEFSKIYDKYIDKIYRFVFLKVSSEDIAQDICSETFTKCWEFYKSKDNTIENHQAFIYRVARNLVTDYYRKKGRTQVVSAENLPIQDPETGLEEKAIFASDLDQVRLALNDLKEDYHNVITWHYLDDLPIKKVAEMLNKSEQNTRVILHRALKALKDRVKEAFIKDKAEESAKAKSEACLLKLQEAYQANPEGVDFEKTARERMGLVRKGEIVLKGAPKQ